MAKPKTAPYLAIKTDVRKDDRFEVLGQIAGYNKYEALGRMSHLWAWCRDRKLEDAPDDSDGYVVAEGVVVRFLGEGGVKAILAAGVDELALGSRTDGGMIYLRGTSETVGALRQRLAAASAGGIARSATPRVNGRYPNSSRDGAETVPTGWKSPAETVPNSSLPPTSDLRPPIQTPTPARAIPQGESAWHRHSRWWSYMRDRHRELRDAGIHPGAPDFAPNFGGHENNMRLCDRYLADSGYKPEDFEAKGRHVIDVFFADSRREGHARWFKPSLIWDPEKFARAVDTTLEEATKSRVAPAKASAKPSGPVGRVEPNKPDDYPATGVVSLRKSQ